MYFAFFKYFFNYIIHARTRQRLLFLAMVGLFISSASLFILQSGMGGLQDKLVARSKNVLGHGTINFHKQDTAFVYDVLNRLKKNWPKLHFLPEYKIELLLRNKTYISPVMVHALDTSKGKLPSFLKGRDLQELITPFDLSRKINMQLGDKVGLISPSHVDSFFGDIPRKVSVFLDDIVVTDVPEIDIFHCWVRLPLIQNLIQERAINTIRIYSQFSKDDMKEFLENFFEKGELELVTWEDQHKTLVQALALENRVMLFLFIVMTGLVSLCITSGLLIFIDKIKIDLASFWILGASKEKLERAFILFLNLISVGTVLFGLFVAFIFLSIMDYYSFEIMPANFVDRTIPFKMDLKGAFISFIVPYGISLTFSFFSSLQFRKQHSHVEHIRSLSS